MVNINVGTDVLKDISLMVFDKDGTLIDLYAYWSSMVDFRVNLAQEKLGLSDEQKQKVIYAMGVDSTNRRLRREGPVGLKKREIVMQAMIDALERIGFSNTYDLCYEIFQEVDKFSINYFADIIKPIDGMFNLLDSLYERGCMIAVATTDKTERADLAMKFLGVSDKISIIVGADMIKNPKPSADMIDVVLGKLGVDKVNAVMVGDAVTDVQMGINAGVCASIGVSSGLTTKERLLEITPYVVPDISMISVLPLY